MLYFMMLLFAAPVAVAGFDLSVPEALLVVLGLLLLRWLITLSGIVAPERSAELVLATISVSHFVEKVRWCMDRLGVDYDEKVSGGTLGAYFAGRSVPQLLVRTGIVRTTIGNSPDILRYLYGRCLAADPAAAAFLEPTAERVELESRLDRYGVNLQVWVYHYMLTDRALMLRAWGADSPRTPAWQRPLLRLLFPVLAFLIRKSFRITPRNHEKAIKHIELLLADIDARLADGRRSILGEPEPNYTDLQFAAFTGLWLMPEDYGGGRADDVRMEREQVPPGMRADIDRWNETYGRAVEYVESLYESRRGTRQ